MVKEHLIALQNRLKKEKIDLYYLNTSDYHMSEYVPEYFKTIEYFSDFSGSLATLLVSQNDAFIFVDGRYHTQADKQCLSNGIKVIKLGTQGALEPLQFIRKFYSNKIVGLDGKRTSIGFVKNLLSNNICIKSKDVYSDLIENRPALKHNVIYELSDKYTGLPRKKKIELIQHCLNGKCHIVNNLESIAYLLNLRSDDILYTPVFMSYLVLINNHVYLFADINRMKKQTQDRLFDDGIVVRPYENYYEFISQIKDTQIVLDENKVNYETYLKISGKHNTIYHQRSFIENMKSIKNNLEQHNIVKAHIYDGVALVRFFMWLDGVDKRTLTEYEVAKKIDEFRLQYKAVDISFNSIVAYNGNAAIIHYGPSKTNSVRLDNKGILLLDTGGQYLEGTTDITRTIALGPVDNEIKKYFTLVLKSMFNLSQMKFIKGISGNQLDAIARKELWAQGVDYRHGTGHGVGNFLSVHETPPNIRYQTASDNGQFEPFKPGMVVSDEPGIYFENKFGIRCENLLLCQKDCENEFGEFLRFDTLTMVPFDTRLIDKKYLDEKTINVLNNYHATVYKALAPHLNESERKYLRKLTQEI